MMNIRKIIPFILMLAIVGAALAACMNNDSAAQPGPTANYAPNATDGAGMNNTQGAGTPGTSGMNGTNGTSGANGASGANGTSGATGTSGANGTSGATGTSGANGNTAATADGALNPFDWANGAADIEKAIARISELSDARVVVTNSTALVGVKFDNAYKGELTERIREMVAAEVLRADPAIQTVAVTSNAEDVRKVYDLSEQIRAGRTADELSAEINAIVRNATTLR